jgi:hypothetical protein
MDIARSRKRDTDAEKTETETAFFCFQKTLSILISVLSVFPFPFPAPLCGCRANEHTYMQSNVQVFCRPKGAELNKRGEQGCRDSAASAIRERDVVEPSLSAGGAHSADWHPVGETGRACCVLNFQEQL